MWQAQEKIALNVRTFYPDLIGRDAEKRQRASHKIVDAIADYYHTAICALPFQRVNNSIFMMQANTILEFIGMRPIQHGRLDMTAMRMDYLSFREYFSWYIERYAIR